MSQESTKSPFADFEMDPDTPTAGIRVPFDGYYFTIAFAGAENPEFGKYLDNKLIPVRAAFPNLKTSDEQYSNVVKDAFLEKLVKGWGSDKYGDGKMVDKDGKALSFTKKNVKELLSDPKLEKLLTQLIMVGNTYRNFLAVANQADAKN